MKAYLALAAAALLAMGGTASAKSTTAVISLDGHCDVITLQITKPVVAGADDPNCATEYGGGMIGKVKGLGGTIVAGVQSPSAPGYQFVIDISYPLVTGGAWSLYVTQDGVTMTPFESGTYTVEGSASHGPKGTTSAFVKH
jgi:hypothetical protein